MAIIILETTVKLKGLSKATCTLKIFSLSIQNIFSKKYFCFLQKSQKKIEARSLEKKYLLHKRCVMD